MIDPGELRVRLTLEAPSETPDGAGGVVRGYVTAGSVWAAVTPVAARGAVDAGSAGATATHRIVVRHPCAADTRHRFRLGARVFRIVSIRDADASGQTLMIEAQERRE